MLITPFDPADFFKGIIVFEGDRDAVGRGFLLKESIVKIVKLGCFSVSSHNEGASIFII